MYEAPSSAVQNGRAGVCRDAFKNYVKAILTRRNSITGVLYKDDPTIMAWDLANEPWVLGDDSGQILTVRGAARQHALSYLQHLLHTC